MIGEFRKPACGRKRLGVPRRSEQWRGPHPVRAFQDHFAMRRTIHSATPLHVGIRSKLSVYLLSLRRSDR